MQNILKILWLISLSASIGYSTTRSDINTIEATENIRYLSQKIAKDYLHLYSRPKRTDIQKNLHDMLEELGESFATIDSSIKEGDTKDMLKYLQYNRDNIENLLGKKVTKETSMQMLDYSEVLLEGADSIAREHSYEFNKEETMLMNIKRDEYMVERLGKFYMASKLGALSQSNRIKMEESKKALQNGLEAILAYKYPDELKSAKKELELFWKSSSSILSHAYDVFTPNLVSISSAHFEHLLSRFATYHSKSQ